MKLSGKRWVTLVFSYFIGLIHSANVRTVNLEKSCVSVEWAEGGATKGKEVGSMKIPLPHLMSSYIKDLCRSGICESLVSDAVLFSLTPVIPALWEAETGRSPDVRSSRPSWPTWRNSVSTKNTKINWAGGTRL